MRRLLAAIKKIGFTIPFNFWTAAAVSLGLIGLSFALYLPSLGFYLDDWPQLYSLIVRGTEGIKTYFLYDDRPFGWWPALLFYKLWGTNAILWHLTNYLLRWLVGFGIWGVFTQLWPSHKREAFWSVLLFAVYPLFNQQSMGVMFVPHWICHLLFIVSLWAMLLSVRNQRWRIPLLFLSLILDIPNLFTSEYFIGTELIRPLILLLALKGNLRKNHVKFTLFYWLPFLALDAFFAYWRLFLLQSYRGMDAVSLSTILSGGWNTVLKLITIIVQDVVKIVSVVWAQALDPNNFNLQEPFKVVAVVLTVLVIGFLACGLWTKRNEARSIVNPDSDAFSKEAIGIGLLGIFVACLPGWILMRSYNGEGLWNDRFAFAAMWSAAIFFVGLLSFLLGSDRFKREIIIIILLGLAVGRNFAITNEYKWSTTWQQRFVSQLMWRVPAVKANTSLISESELFTKMGVYPTSFMLNLVYPSQQSIPALDHWFFTIQKYFPTNQADLASGILLEEEHWYARYSADSRDSLVVAWNRSGKDCLWVLSANDRYNPLLSGNTQNALAASNLSRILTENPIVWPDQNLFGKEDRNTWCYYYEAADLARQVGDWQSIVSLYEQAKERGYSPANGVELIPFIEGYARSGQADVAADLTKIAKSLTPLMRDYTCDTWNRIAKDVQNDPLFDSEYKAYSEQDLCWEVK